MPTLTIKRARKILGKAADHINDEEIKKDIDVAELLKGLFFSQYMRRSKTKPSMNKEAYGKA